MSRSVSAGRVVLAGRPGRDELGMIFSSRDCGSIGHIEWWFRNRQTGQITIGQVPNVPLVVFLVAWGIDFVVSPGGSVGTALDLIAAFALFIWAVDELVRGVNPFRRLLGAAVLGGLVAQLV